MKNKLILIVFLFNSNLVFSQNTWNKFEIIKNTLFVSFPEKPTHDSTFIKIDNENTSLVHKYIADAEDEEQYMISYILQIKDFKKGNLKDKFPSMIEKLEKNEHFENIKITENIVKGEEIISLKASKSNYLFFDIQYIVKKQKLYVLSVVSEEKYATEEQKNMFFNSFIFINK